MSSERIKSLIKIFGIIVLFIFFSYLAKTNLDFFKELLGNKTWGLFFWFLITITAVVIAPITNLFLMPLVSNIFGWMETAIVSVAAWSIGSFIVFYICRKYGVDLVKKFISLDQLHKIESKIPKENLFLDLILLRMIIPVEILSYGIGLFSKINFKMYAITTIIGLMPVAFLISYLGIVPLPYQILGGITLFLLIILIHLIRELFRIRIK